MSEVRARLQVGIMSQGGWPDIIGTIEMAHNELAGHLEPFGLKPVGRPVIDAAGQREMTLSWRLEPVP